MISLNLNTERCPLTFAQVKEGEIHYLEFSSHAKLGSTEAASRDSCPISAPRSCAFHSSSLDFNHNKILVKPLHIVNLQITTMSSRNKKTSSKRKVTAVAQDFDSSLSLLVSPAPSPPHVGRKVEQQSQRNDQATTPNDPTNSTRSITPPTISPLSDHRPLMSSPDDTRGARSESPSPSPAQEPAPAPLRRSQRGRNLEVDDSDDSGSALSSLRSDSAEYQPAGTAPLPAARDALPENKPIFFTPYFKRPGFIPAPEVTGKEAWAKNRVWNEETKKFDIIDSEKIAKY
jgi:hypothetical protein